MSNIRPGAGVAAGVLWPIQAVGQALSALWPGMTAQVLSEIDSTNSELMRRARAGRTQPVLLVAEQQTAGRGRLGRSWQSQAHESLTLSLGVPLGPADWSGLSLAVGVGLAESLHPRLQLKWPNDLWLDGRKLAGVLIETASFASGPKVQRYAIVGVGINIAAPEAAGLDPAPAGLEEVLPHISPGEVLLRVAAPLVQTVQSFEAFGFAAFQARFAARDALRDRVVRSSDGIQGTAHGVTEAGVLLVHTAQGMRTITSFEVSVRPG